MQARSSGPDRPEMPGHYCERLQHLPLKSPKWRLEDGLSGHTHELNPVREVVRRCAVSLTEAPLRPVSLNRTAHLPAHCKPDLPGSFPPSPEHEQRRALDAFPALEYRLKDVAPLEPLGPGDPANRPVTCHTASARP